MDGKKTISLVIRVDESHETFVIDEVNDLLLSHAGDKPINWSWFDPDPVYWQP
jgi:hypothetical protein